MNRLNSESLRLPRPLQVVAFALLALSIIGCSVENSEPSTPPSLQATVPNCEFTHVTFEASHSLSPESRLTIDVQCTKPEALEIQIVQMRYLGLLDMFPYDTGYSCGYHNLNPIDENEHTIISIRSPGPVTTFTTALVVNSQTGVFLGSLYTESENDEKDAAAVDHFNETIKLPEFERPCSDQL